MLRVHLKLVLICIPYKLQLGYFKVTFTPFSTADGRNKRPKNNHNESNYQDLEVS